MNVYEIALLSPRERTGMQAEAERAYDDARYALAQVKLAEAVAQLRALHRDAGEVFFDVHGSNDSDARAEVTRVGNRRAGAPPLFVLDGGEDDDYPVDEDDLTVAEDFLTGAAEADGGALAEFLHDGQFVLVLRETIES